MKILSVIILSLAFVAKAADTNALPALVPAYGEIPPKFFEQHGTPVIIGIFTLIVLAALALWKTFQPKPAVVLPPEIVAREALAKLQSYSEDGKVLSAVSQILRRYVVAAFGLSAAELTTKEFCAAVAADEKIGTEISNSISSFLRESDNRKFSPSPIAAPLNAAARALELVAAAEKRRPQITIAK
jgi:Domain of unknown function (DUF4381)